MSEAESGIHNLDVKHVEFVSLYLRIVSSAHCARERDRMNDP